MEHADRFGCYRIGDLKFYSKLEAIEWHKTTGIHPHWDFNEAVFDTYDWSKEPAESILELYRQRAQQLRDKYDYVIVMYSGGADSQTVLDSFVNNDIHVDEICTWQNYTATKDKDDYVNSEVFQVVLPAIQQLKTTHPWIRHRIIDLAQLTAEYYSQDQHKFSWIYQVNNMIGPNNAARQDLALRVKEWADIIHSGRKLCVVWGKDKLRLMHDNNRYSCRFLDLVSDAAASNSLSGQQVYSDELFFWTPDHPKIVIKQSHLLKTYMNSAPNPAMLPFVSLIKSDLAYKTFEGKKYWLSADGYHSVIYPQWRLDTFTYGKPSSIVVSLRDTWFYKISPEDPIRHNYDIGLKKIFELLPEYWLNDPKDLTQGMKFCWSKDYYLE